MRLSACLAFTGFAVALFPLSAPAGEGCNGFDVVGHIFEASDRDGSGTLSRAEYEAAGLERYGVSFEGYDANGDGEASLDEYRALYDRYHRAEGEIES